VLPNEDTQPDSASSVDRSAFELRRTEQHVTGSLDMSAENCQISVAVWPSTTLQVMIAVVNADENKSLNFQSILR